MRFLARRIGAFEVKGRESRVGSQRRNLICDNSLCLTGHKSICSKGGNGVPKTIVYLEIILQVLKFPLSLHLLVETPAFDLLSGHDLAGLGRSTRRLPSFVSRSTDFARVETFLNCQGLHT